MPKHRIGNKISRSHTTLIDAAVKVVDAVRKMSEVKKIALGEIKPISSGQQRLKVTNGTNGGLKLTVRGSSSVQTIYVATSNPMATKKAIEKTFGK